VEPTADDELTVKLPGNAVEKLQVVEDMVKAGGKALLSSKIVGPAVASMCGPEHRLSLTSSVRMVTHALGRREGKPETCPIFWVSNFLEALEVLAPPVPLQRARVRRRKNQGKEGKPNVPPAQPKVPPPAPPTPANQASTARKKKRANLANQGRSGAPLLKATASRIRKQQTRPIVGGV
jgi:hypothetical protein